MNEKIDWPSERVAQGGMFHPAKVKYSKDTHDLIKLLMEEQRLTMSQRNKVNYHLRNGDPLPPPKKPQRERQQDYEDQLASHIMTRARNSRKRTLDVIAASGAYELEKYVPIHHLREPSDKQKIRLQERMSGVKEYPELDSLNVKARHKIRKASHKPEPNLDPIKELMDEIYERADWLADMEELGEGKPHRQVIHAQIAERLRKVKQLEKKRQLEQGALQLEGDSITQ